MKDEVTYTLGKLKEAVGRLREGVAQAKTDLAQDGVIQRFEFTFELLWKSLKVCLADKGVDAKTPKDCLKAAFRIGWISDEAAFLDMLEDRNKTSHVYDQADSRKIFERIKMQHLSRIEMLFESLEKNR